MKRKIIIMLMCCVFLSGVCLADTVDDFAVSSVTKPDESPLDLAGVKFDPAILAKFQNFNFTTTHFVDPVAVVVEKKSSEMDKTNCLVLSLRKSKMSGSGQANDLQVDVCWKGQFSKKTSVVKGRLVYDWCQNPVVAIIAEEDIHLKIRAELVKQLREICDATTRVVLPPLVQQPECATSRRPGVMTQSTGKSRTWIAEEGILKFCFGLSWLLNQPSVNNNLVANGGNGYGAAASSSTSTSTSTSSSSATGPDGTGTTSAGQSTNSHSESGAP